MPIGVPRILYCWGEEVPPQWTDIYNFIFRRRMIFLMQYLDDELCNQICGLLINIHMEDMSEELETDEMEKSGLTQKTTTDKTKKKSIDDLLKSEEDLAIDENYKLEQYTLQKITMEWLNWNAQFFDYADEPYFYYLAEILAKDFNQTDGKLLYTLNNSEMGKLMTMFKNAQNYNKNNFSNVEKPFDVYSPFRQLANIVSNDFSVKDFNPKSNGDLMQKFTQLKKTPGQLVSDLANEEFLSKRKNSFEKTLGQRRLRKQYGQDFFQENLSYKESKSFGGNSLGAKEKMRPLSYLNFDTSLPFDLNGNEETNYNELRDYYRKEAERILQEEESKKVFMMINSFGGSVGNGITVYDALQFIKAGSLTLALGVAASAASLALAGGTIGERYVTEGCHVMIHQPEGGLSGQASDIWIDSLEIMKIRQEVAEIYSLSTYRPRHKILRDLDRDFYLTATETISYGLADEIATNEVMEDIIQMTSKAWQYDETRQERLFEALDKPKEDGNAEPEAG